MLTQRLTIKSERKQLYKTPISLLKYIISFVQKLYWTFYSFFLAFNSMFMFLSENCLNPPWTAWIYCLWVFRRIWCLTKHGRWSLYIQVYTLDRDCRIYFSKMYHISSPPPFPQLNFLIPLFILFHKNVTPAKKFYSIK